MTKSALVSCTLLSWRLLWIAVILDWMLLNFFSKCVLEFRIVFNFLYRYLLQLKALLHIGVSRNSISLHFVYVNTQRINSKVDLNLKGHLLLKLKGITCLIISLIISSFIWYKLNLIPCSSNMSMFNLCNTLYRTAN